MKHKWHDEIVAWAGGAEIEFSYSKKNGVNVWMEAAAPLWNCGEDYIYRIKPQDICKCQKQKEKKYLYVVRERYGLSISEHAENYIYKFEVQDE